MAKFLMLRGDLWALNMDHVEEVQAGTQEGTVAVTMRDGRTKIIGGTEARRVQIWLQAHAELPIVPPGGSVLPGGRE